MSIKVVQIVGHSLNKHNNPEFALKVMQDWTTERQNYFLSRLDWIEKSLDQGNHEAYRIAFNQLQDSIKNQKATLDKLHDKILFDDAR